MIGIRLTIMELKERLLAVKSKSDAKSIAEEANRDSRMLAQLVDLFFGDHQRITQKVSFVILQIDTYHPRILRPYWTKFEEALISKPLNKAQKRNILRILESKPKAYTNPASLFNKSYELCGTPSESIAVRCFAMKILTNIAVQHKDLAPEVLELIRLIEEEPNLSSGLKSRIRRLRPQLEKITYSKT